MARIIQARDALVARIQAEWSAGMRESADDAVSAPWVVRIEADKLKGRKILVFPSTYTTELASRVTDRGDYTFVLLVAERYWQQGDPTDGWVSERVNFCEWLSELLGDVRGPRLLATNSRNGLWPELSEVSTVYDVEELTERKLFVSVLTITYREEG